ncbi:glycosyltransferase [Variovorax sp. YR752]|uniref:glycosyltransferase family protein n=1 Tax=Variovorax sp. YR752 TaxID=1884383 RepID=UPI0031379E1D
MNARMLAPLHMAGGGMPWRPLRLLHLPNEEQVGFQVGPREAFDTMLAGGELSAYTAYPFLHEAASHGMSACLEQLLRVASEQRPDVVIWQHVGRFPVDAGFLRRLREVIGSAVLVYHEGDVFGRWVKPLPAPVRALAAEADVVSLVGLGELAALFRAHGARRIVYAPHSFDSRRCDQPWTPTPSRRFDALMIGNRVTSRVPLRDMPGARERFALAEALHRRLGERFVVHGGNWGNRPYARGPLPFDQQELAIREAWLTVSWDHFDQVPCYFSDRVPIAMAAGVVHVTNRQPGYEQLFPPGCGLLHAGSVDELADIVDLLLSRPRDELIDLGERAQAFARERLSARRVYRDLLLAVAGMFAERLAAH